MLSSLRRLNNLVSNIDRANQCQKFLVEIQLPLLVKRVGDHYVQGNDVSQSRRRTLTVNVIICLIDIC